MSEKAGLLRVSSSGRYLTDERGAPFFWMGDTAWPLLATYTREEAERYLRLRARQGFTVVQTVIAWGDPEPEKDLWGTPPKRNYAGHPVWIDGDPSRPNAAFFENVDHLLRVADELGLTVALYPVWGYSVYNTKVVNTSNAYAYGEWLGRRYKNAPNFVWVLGGDREPLGYEDVYRELARGLKAGDGGAHIMTYHPNGWRSSSYYFHNEPWLDFNMIQTWAVDCVYQAVLGDYLLLPPKPTVIGETTYEAGNEYPDGPITPLVTRRLAWWAHMGGGFYTYGHSQSWRMEAGWLEAVEAAPGGHQMAIFKRVANSRRWWEMIPDSGIITHGISEGHTRNTACRAIDRSWAMVYFASQTHMRLLMDRIAQRYAKATWVNPATGEERDGGIYETGNFVPGAIMPLWKWEWFSVPNHWEDAVLILNGAEG